MENVPLELDEGMTDRYRRYAIYWTPEPGSALEAFGSAWFGGENFGLEPDLAARAKRAPARYGLHATLKAPFRLREGATADDIARALDAFCRIRRAPEASPLGFIRHQRYVVLSPGGRTAAIDWLAAECVTHFDRFRAPIGDADRAAREIDTMTARERAHLEDFGYPYVLSEFRFHISLAGPLERCEALAVCRALEPQLAPMLLGAFRIDALTLLGEPEGGGAFQILSRHRFMSADLARP